MIPIPIKKLNQICGYVGGILFLIGAFTMLYDIICRYGLNSPSQYATYIVSFLTLGAIFIGGGYSFQVGGQVFIEILVDKLKPLPRRVSMSIGYCLGLIFVIALLIQCARGTAEAFTDKWVATGNLSFPLYILYGVMVFGCALLAITIVVGLIDMWRKKEEISSENTETIDVGANGGDES